MAETTVDEWAWLIDSTDDVSLPGYITLLREILFRLENPSEDWEEEISQLTWKLEAIRRRIGLGSDREPGFIVHEQLKTESGEILIFPELMKRYARWPRAEGTTRIVCFLAFDPFSSGNRGKESLILSMDDAGQVHRYQSAIDDARSWLDIWLRFAASEKTETRNDVPKTTNPIDEFLQACEIFARQFGKRFNSRGKVPKGRVSPEVVRDLLSRATEIRWTMVDAKNKITELVDTVAELCREAGEDAKPIRNVALAAKEEQTSFFEYRNQADAILQEVKAKASKDNRSAVNSDWTPCKGDVEEDGFVSKHDLDAVFGKHIAFKTIQNLYSPEADKKGANNRSLFLYSKIQRLYVQHQSSLKGLMPATYSDFSSMLRSVQAGQ